MSLCKLESRACAWKRFFHLGKILLKLKIFFFLCIYKALIWDAVFGFFIFLPPKSEIFRNLSQCATIILVKSLFPHRLDVTAVRPSQELTYFIIIIII